MDNEECGHCDGPHTPGRGFVSADPKADERARPTILLIDDEKLSRSSLKAYIEADSEGLSGSRILEAESFEEALDALSKESVHVVVLDRNLGPDANDPRHNGLSLIPEALSLRPHVQILMLTGCDDVQDIVKAIQSGACGYLLKGSKPELIVSQIQKAMQTARMSIDNARRERGVTPSTCKIEVPGKSIAMRKLSSQLQAVAESDRPVLLLGETGVGKTTIARLIHKYRRNCLEISDRPFVEVNLSSLNSGTLERELFGNEKGAYTDAKRMHEGLLEVADHGTLFIDEIGDVSLDIQVKLLKAIEEKKFMRVGGTRQIESHFKLICATNRDLEKLVEQGRFREDFYMRIATFQVKIPPLRERAEDIPDLVKSVLPKASNEARVRVVYEDLPQDFIQALMNHPPRGNIRGIDDALAQLLTFSPKNDFGRPHLDRWKSIEELKWLVTAKVKAMDDAIPLQKFLNSPLDVVGPGFPGLEAVLDSVKNRIFLDAKFKYPNNRARAKVLRVSESWTSITYQRIRTRRRSLRSDKYEGPGCE